MAYRFLSSIFNPGQFVLYIMLSLVCCYECNALDLITVSSFSTSIEDQEENVKKNLRLACEKLNGYVIPPKSVFSFNQVVGEGSAKNGFVNGRVLYIDEVRYEPGGGLCQASSRCTTLFCLPGSQSLNGTGTCSLLLMCSLVWTQP